MDNYGVLKEWAAVPFGSSTPHHTSYFRRELAPALRTLKRGAKILEIGFGNGSSLAYLRSQGFAVHGVELDETQIAKARTSGFTAFHTSEIDRLSGYDLVVAFDVLEHLTMDELHDLSRSLHRLLIPGGQFIARFPNGQSPFGLINQHGDITHKTSIGPEMVRQLCRMHGLDVIAIRNPVVLFHRNPVKAVGRAMQALLAKMIEATISFAFYSRVEPLNINLVAHVRRPHRTITQS